MIAPLAVEKEDSQSMIGTTREMTVNVRAPRYVLPRLSAKHGFSTRPMSCPVSPSLMLSKGVMATADGVYLARNRRDLEDGSWRGCSRASVQMVRGLRSGTARLPVFL